MLRNFIYSLALITLLCGCGGGGAKNYNITRTTTTGQELKDLKEANERGAITTEEYETMKEKILKSRDD